MNSKRGIRNCNPLNIRRVAGVVWKGQRHEQTDWEFVEFDSFPWGIRAAFCILDTYRKKYNATCVEDIIARWAPPSENDTKGYVQTVCRLTGFGGKERLSENEWPKLVRAMATVESGATLEDRDMELGVQLYQMLNQKQPKK